MSKPYTGGCACGAIRYETKHQPIFQNHCHCLDCQHRSGTGHASWLTFPAAAEMVIKGKAVTWATTGDSGEAKVHAFCPTCGASVYLTSPVRPEMIAVHAASLDEPARFEPTVVTYGVRGLAWDRLDPALTMFEKMPSG
jgi:hypothetical protein